MPLSARHVTLLVICSKLRYLRMHRKLQKGTEFKWLVHARCKSSTRVNQRDAWLNALLYKPSPKVRQQLSHLTVFLSPAAKHVCARLAHSISTPALPRWKTGHSPSSSCVLLEPQPTPPNAGNAVHLKSTIAKGWGWQACSFEKVP